MSYTEYEDLFYKSQKNGFYHMFIFDIKNSRSYDKNLNYIEQVSQKLITNVYNRIKMLENARDKIILHRSNLFDSINDKFYKNGTLCDPFKLGDMFGFTVIRGSIDSDEVYQIFEEEKTKLNIYWNFHMMDGYYETDDYVEGHNKYYRGYCMQQLEALSKTKKLRKNS